MTDALFGDDEPVSAFDDEPIAEEVAPATTQPQIIPAILSAAETPTEVDDSLDTELAVGAESGSESGEQDAVDARVERLEDESSHYLLIGSGAQSPAQVMALLRFIELEQPTVGQDLAAARQANQVTIVGEPESKRRQLEQDLRNAGARIMWLTLDELVEMFGPPHAGGSTDEAFAEEDIDS
ncbi:MAG: hypothetical protein HC802_11425 [Caldilineaceae bacterium]|nr:hypothetical protein [Caldilineaceae bacterium]